MKKNLLAVMFLVASGLGSITGALTVAWMGDIHNKGRVALTALAGDRS